MILGCHVMAADIDETWRLWTTIEVWWPAVEVLIATRVSNARAEAANTGIKQIKRISAADTGTWTTTNAVSSATSRSPDRRKQQHDREPR